MDRSTVERLVCYVLDASLDGRIIELGNGTEYALKILNPCYFLWDWADWNEFAAEQKKQRKQQRREVQHAIDYSVEHRLAI